MSAARPRRLVVEADGGSRGNPGVAGYGALVRDADSGDLLAERAEPLGTASNNVAEYRGLIAGLTAAEALAPDADITVRMDSKLVVEQMSGRWKIKHEDMRRLALEARDIAGRITGAGGAIRYEWIPRADNTDADALSNVAMDGETVDRVHSTAGAEGTAAQSADVSAEVDMEVDAAVETVVDGTATSDLQGAPATPGLRGEPTRVVLVRHGETTFTVEGRLDGRGGPDPSLTAQGLAQAESAGRLVAHLLDGGSARVVTSSLARAAETGAIVARAVGVTPTVDADWDEQSFGEWDGRTVADLLGAHRDDFRRLRDDLDFAAPGGESHTALTERVLGAWERVVTTGGTTVVVCHRKPIMVVLSHLLQIPPVVAWRVAAAPGSLTGVEVWPSGEVSVAFTNRH